ncbi:MAG: lysophospholipid acyltransferase family protein [Verrucomicrobiae bacterium]|nr:lysophospholipid acyltransferase family protein [Verrucomicrobiae bacterium]
MEPTEPVRLSRKLKAIQAVMGFFAWLLLALPYGRRTTGLEKLDPKRRYLFVSNHVSLLDTILLGAVLSRSGNYPILVLGDKAVWKTSWIKSALSRPIGFLLERGKLNPGRIRELQKYARLVQDFNLVVFPEGTRGNGVEVAVCQPGIYYVAQESRAVIVPVFIENMHLVSTKQGKFHPLSGLRKIETHFGEPILPEVYLGMEREAFTELVRRQIAATKPTPPAGRLSPDQLPG